jgi:hypothetical protein
MGEIKEGLKVGGWTLWIGVLAAVVLAGAIGLYLTAYRTVAPEFENVRREVFENTQSFVHGKNQHISRLAFEYTRSEPGHRDALRQMIIGEASTIDNEDLTAENRAFVYKLRMEAGLAQ